MSWTGGTDLTGWFSSTGGVTAITFTGLAIPAGTLVVLGVCGNTASVSFSCADNSTQSGAANTWINNGALNGTTFTADTFYCILTRALLSTDTITVTLSLGCSRTAGCGGTYTCTSGNPIFDNANEVRVAATTSPVTTSASALHQASELAVAFSFWKGGTAAPGSFIGASQISGPSTHPEFNSGGVTTNVAARFADGTTTSAASGTTSWTYTSITNVCLQTLFFYEGPAIVAGLAPITAQDSSQGYDKPNRYRAPLSQVASVYSNPTIPQALVAMAQSRQIPAPPRKSSVTNVFDPALNQFRDWAQQPAMSRPVPFYKGSPDFVVSPSDNTPILPVWAPTAPDRASALYRGGPSQVAGAADQLELDPWSVVYLSRPVPLYRSPLSWATPVFTPNPAQGTDYAAVFQGNRAFPFYASPRSLAINAIDNVPIPDSYAAVFASRVVPFLRSPAAVVVPVWDPSTNSFRDWTPGVVTDRPVPAYSAPRSQAISAFTPNTPDQWAQVLSRLWRPLYVPPMSQVAEAFAAPIAAGTDWTPTAQSRIVLPYRGGASSVAGAADQVLADVYAAVFSDRPVPYYLGPRSASVPVFTPNAPDQWAGVAQSAWQARRKPGTSTVTTATASPPGQGYVAVARSRGPLARLVSSATYVTADFGVLIVTQPPMGGGGEWVIWVKPDFPANRAGAWRQFPAPSFRRPTRREQRGY